MQSHCSILPRSSVIHISKSTLLALLVSAFYCVAAIAQQVEPLVPTEGQKRTTKEIILSLSGRHYRNLPVDDDLSSRYLDKYLSTLDPAKSFFFASDVKEFERYRKQFDDDLKSGNLNDGFAIFNRYRDRVVIRLKAIIARLEREDLNFDFTKDDELSIDLDDAEWATDQEQANQMWHKRLKSNLLNLVLADQTTRPIDVDMNQVEEQTPNVKTQQQHSPAPVDDAEVLKYKLAEAKKTLVRRYKNQLNRIMQQNATDVFEIMMNSLALLYDPHTSYFSPPELENFNITMSLSLEGIGAELSQQDDYTEVHRIVTGGPAYKQGELKPEDKIVAVGQGDEGELVDVIGWRLDEVVNLIRGPRDTVVRLKVIPAKSDGLSKVIRITRNTVKLEDQAAQKAVFNLTDGSKVYKIGVIDVPAFYIDFDAYRRHEPNYKSTTADVAMLLDELEADGVNGIIIDLRDNGGGSLQEAEMLTDLFIDPGPVVQIRQSDDKIYRGSNLSRSLAKYRGPMVVLINRLSASASEIFAGAIQDYQRGLIVGSQSFGKGTVQSLTPVYEGQIKITESKFYRVSGDSTQHRGVVPDVKFPNLIDTDEVGESSYENALPWDQIRPVPHAQYFDMSGMTPYLQRQHDARAAKDPDLVYLFENYALVKENRDRKVLSLNIAKRRAEQEAFNKKELQIENKRRMAKGLTPYKSFDDYNKEEEADNDAPQAEADEDKINPDKDPILNETGLVLVDFIKLLEADRIQKVANF